MWKCRYGDEPLDLKLFWLRFIKKCWIILVSVLAGAFVFGGCYFAASVAFAPQKEYRAVAETYIDYLWEDAYGVSRVYMNESVWAALVKTDIFVDDVMGQLEQAGLEADRELLRESMEASLVSDSRIVTTTVTMEDPELSAAVCRALQNAIQHYADTQQGIVGTRVLTSPENASQVTYDSRLLQAAVLGAVLGGLFSAAALAFYLAADDSVHVPETFEHRYGIPMLGTLSSPELSVNLQYLCRDRAGVAVIAVEEDVSTEEIAAALSEKLKEQKTGQDTVSLQAGGCVLKEPWQAKVLRAADGVILAVAAGRHDGKRIEKTLDFLEKQDCQVVAALLWQADEGLLKRYYGLGMTGRKGQR